MEISSASRDENATRVPHVGCAPEPKHFVRKFHDRIRALTKTLSSTFRRTDNQLSARVKHARLRRRLVLRGLWFREKQARSCPWRPIYWPLLTLRGAFSPTDEHRVCPSCTSKCSAVSRGTQPFPSRSSRS